MAFSLASPLAKFLNGLEILLSKAQVSSANKIPPDDTINFKENR